jgi:hypothetical protein
MGRAVWLERLLGVGASIWTFLAPVVPGTVAAIVIGTASSSVAWLNQFGAFGWLVSGLIAFVLTAVAMALIAKARIWRIEAKARARQIGESSPFDPMARIYEGKRLYLRDLAPVGRKQVIDKKFVDCEIIGPGTAVLGLRSSDHKPFPQMKDSSTFDVDAVEIRSDVISQLAVAFVDCDFDGCKFYHMTLLFTERMNHNLHWITKPATPQLLEDRTEPSRELAE